MSDDVLTLDALMADCQKLEVAVVRSRLGTKEELVTVAPGGAENPDEGIRGWLRYFGHLHRLHAHRERTTASSAGSAHHNPEAEALMMSVLAEEPMAVALATPTKWLKRTQLVYVQPKSFRTLSYIKARDAFIERAAVVAASVKDELTKSPKLQWPKGLEELMLEIEQELVFQTEVMIWIATEGGKNLPFERGAELEIPKWIQALTPIDIINILKAFHLVNNTALIMLDRLFDATMDDPEDSSKGKRRLSWSVFFADLAMEMGVSAEELISSRSLGSVFASRYIAARAKRQAEYQSKQEREHGH